MTRRPALREALLTEALARVSGGAAIAALAHADLGMMGLFLFGAGVAAAPLRRATRWPDGRSCASATPRAAAGSDVAAVGTRAEPVEGGWRLTGTKSYVTNGAVADLAVVTAVTDPEGPAHAAGCPCSWSTCTHPRWPAPG